MLGFPEDFSCEADFWLPCCSASSADKVLATHSGSVQHERCSDRDRPSEKRACSSCRLPFGALPLADRAVCRGHEPQPTTVSLLDRPAQPKGSSACDGPPGSLLHAEPFFGVPRCGSPARSKVACRRCLQYTRKKMPRKTARRRS